MNKEELKEIFNDIQFQMICEQNTGYKNEYSRSLQQKMNLYNYIIDLKQALIDIKEILRKYDFKNNRYYKTRLIEDNNKMLQIIDKVLGE